MYKIAVMGDWDSIYGFAALGLTCFRVDGNNTEEAEKTVREKTGQDVKMGREESNKKWQVAAAVGVTVAEGSSPVGTASVGTGPVSSWVGVS